MAKKKYTNIQLSAKAFNQRMVALEKSSKTDTTEYKSMKSFVETSGAGTAKGRLSPVKAEKFGMTVERIDTVGIQKATVNRANRPNKERTRALRNAKRRKERMEKKNMVNTSKYQKSLDVLNNAKSNANIKIETINDLFRSGRTKAEKKRAELENLINRNKEILYTLIKAGISTEDEYDIIELLKSGNLGKTNIDEAISIFKKLEKDINTERNVDRKNAIEYGKRITEFNTPI